MTPDSPSSQSPKSSTESSQTRAKLPAVPPLRMVCDRMPDGFVASQFNEKEINIRVAHLTNAVSELYDRVSQLIERVNRGS